MRQYYQNEFTFYQNKFKVSSAPTITQNHFFDLKINENFNNHVIYFHRYLLGPEKPKLYYRYQSYDALTSLMLIRKDIHETIKIVLLRIFTLCTTDNLATIPFENSAQVLLNFSAKTKPYFVEILTEIFRWIREQSIRPSISQITKLLTEIYEADPREKKSVLDICKEKILFFDRKLEINKLSDFRPSLVVEHYLRTFLNFLPADKFSFDRLIQDPHGWGVDIANEYQYTLYFVLKLIDKGKLLSFEKDCFAEWQQIPSEASEMFPVALNKPEFSGQLPQNRQELPEFISRALHHIQRMEEYFAEIYNYRQKILFPCLSESISDETVYPSPENNIKKDLAVSVTTGSSFVKSSETFTEDESFSSEPSVPPKALTRSLSVMNNEAIEFAKQQIDNYLKSHYSWSYASDRIKHANDFLKELNELKNSQWNNQALIALAEKYRKISWDTDLEINGRARCFSFWTRRNLHKSRFRKALSNIEDHACGSGDYSTSLEISLRKMPW